MKFKEFLRFAYGLVMGTSTPFLKSKKRFLFPAHREQIDLEFGVFLGGSCLCGVIQGGDDILVVNVNQGTPAREFLGWVEEKDVPGSATVVLTALRPDFAGGISLYRDAKRILVGVRERALLPEGWGHELHSRAEFVTEEMIIDFGDERARLIPLAKGMNEAQLAVFLERRSALFLGPAFYNAIHPVLSLDVDLKVWTTTLEKLLERFSPKVVVPGEGDLSNPEGVHRFVAYLKDLADPAVEFSYCRQNYDWMEIPNTTSLEENFEILRRSARKHVPMN